mmetsp:Transcript_16499/g.42229  ORF Transcript_16499/g.42229 Transcript_16499/m.42229 type:complete len:125 (+) Transcript_16499:84-458(+)|eukprot:CAMPEP_0177645222 /NCGR_PEP_ID=MMETSP0447-20121125/9134_1 /TAXON_ID=0 /ORGANISM="Stygamoeba regulata, Strain BSH-02190019" /LENGTH=124 /DNA_ID=CAMNT_0019147691 /DNA_START=72 /DNA_END=446 /DNA_ORIENTATION=-
MVAKIKVADLRVKTKQELEKQLEELKQELSQLRVAQISGNQAGKLSQIKVVRKSIARVQTVLNQNQKSELRTFYKNKKYQPLDLRTKKTRAIRRQLSEFERKQTTLRQDKKARHWAPKKFAVRA